MTSGVYRITHKKTGNSYIGKSVQIEFRWNQHRKLLEEGSHYCQRLQQDFTNSAGWSDFEFVIIEEIPPRKDILKRREAETIREYELAGRAYNKYRPVPLEPFKIELTEGGDKVLNITEAATYLGVSRQTISRWQAGGYLPEGKRFSKEDLDQLGHYNLKDTAEFLKISRVRVHQLIWNRQLPDKPRWRLDELQEVAPKIRRVHHKIEKAIDLSPWADLMGKVPDVKIAKEAGCSIKTVQLWRAKRGIKATRPRGY